MLKKSLTTLLAVMSLLAAVAVLTPAIPAAASPPAHGPDLAAWAPLDLSGFLAELWRDLLGVRVAATCNEEDPCAPDACYPDFCPCDSDPCAENACNPEACDGNGGGDGGGNGGRFDPGG